MEITELLTKYCDQSNKYSTESNAFCVFKCMLYNITFSLWTLICWKSTQKGHDIICLCSQSTTTIPLKNKGSSQFLEFYLKLSAKIKHKLPPHFSSLLSQDSSLPLYNVKTFFYCATRTERVQLVWHHDICTKTVPLCASPLNNSPLCSQMLSAECVKSTVKNEDLSGLLPPWEQVSRSIRPVCLITLDRP